MDDTPWNYSIPKRKHQNDSADSTTGIISPLGQLTTEPRKDLQRFHNQDSPGKWDKNGSDRRNQKPYNKKIHPNVPPALNALFMPLKCQLCSADMSSDTDARTHYKSNEHDANMRRWIAKHPEYAHIRLGDTSKQAVEDSWHCELCNVKMTSESNAQAHYAGKKHQDMITGKRTTVSLAPTAASENNPGMVGTGKPVTGAASSTSSSSLAVLDHQVYHCDLCDVYSTSDVTRADHLNGARHRKKAAQVSVQSGRFGIGQAFLEVGASSFAVLTQRVHRCDLCDVTCSSEMGLNDHFNGAKHKKKAALASDSSTVSVVNDNILDTVVRRTVKSPPPTDLSIYRTPTGKYYCSVCNVNVNSQSQFLQHSESKKHKSKRNLSKTK